MNALPALAKARTAARPHAAERWAHAVVRLLRSHSDVRNIDTWGRTIGASRGTLRTWCSAAGVPAKSSLDFARILRSLLLSQGGPWDFFNTLDIVDERTLRRLIARGGIAELKGRGQTPDARVFIATQRFVRNPMALTAIVQLLSAQEYEEPEAPRRAS